MPNDFEKQVQQKMEELNFSPSEPVWTNIEKEIRKKDKRRFFIWIPILLALLGGGYYCYYSINAKTHIQMVVNDNNNSKKAISNQNTNTSSKPTTEKSIETDKENNDLGSIISNTNKKQNTVSIHKYYSLANSFKKLKKSDKSSMVKAIVMQHEDDVDINSLINSKNFDESIEHNQLELEHIFPIPSFNFLLNPTEHSIVNGSENKVVHVKRYKWKPGIEFSVGISNQSSDIRSLNKSYAAYSVGSIPFTNPIIQSPYTKNISFSVGFNFTKRLNGQFNFQTGINYQYLSFNILVGQYVKHDTVVSYSSVNQFYRNTALSSSISTATSNYKNELHFISLPVKIHFKPFRKTPFVLSAGFIAQELIHSNMLIYDEYSGVYFSSSKSLNKFLISSTAGIEYSFPVLKHSFTIGPYYNYGLGNTIKYKAGQLSNFNFRISMDLKN